MNTRRFGRWVGCGMVLVAGWLLLGVGGRRVAAEGDAGQVAGEGIIKKTLEHDGVTRTYYVHLPPEFDKRKPAPLVLALHGGGGQAAKFERQATQGTLTAAADKRGVVLVFPEGVDRHWCDGRIEVLEGKPALDDVGFLSKLIDTMAEEYGIDRRRVYATGISNGGFMSIRLAMDLSDKLAAVAPVAAQISKAIEEKTPKLPISVMVVNGTDDPLVPYDGGHVRVFKYARSRGEILSTDETIERFRRHNGCGDTPEKSTLPDKAPDDETRVEMERYTGGREGSEVVLVRVVGGGHTWPGGRQYLAQWIVGTVSRDIDASEMILNFFLRHERKGK